MTTIYIDAVPGTYEAYKTIGGWVVNFVVSATEIRPVDGGKVHKSRQNAYAKVDRLNHPLKYIFKKHDMAEVYFDGYTAGVGVGDDEMHGYDLYVQRGGMPPHFSKHCATLAEVEEEMRDSFFPQPIKWQAVKSEEI